MSTMAINAALAMAMAGGNGGSSGANKMGLLSSLMGGVSKVAEPVGNILGGLGMGGKETSLEKVSTMNPLQSKIFNYLGNKALTGSQGYKPYPGAISPSPNANQKAIFGQVPGMLSRLTNKTQGQAAPQTNGTEAEQKSVAEIINSGQSAIISKILKAVGGK